MWVLSTGNLWGGVSLRYDGITTVMAVLSFLLVGVAEEIVFRGFLFNGMKKSGNLTVAIIVSAVTTKYRDLAMLVTFGVHLWMYGTPVTYSTSMIADKFPQLLNAYMLNPITPIIELFRAAYLGVPRYSYGYSLLSVIVTAAVFLLGVILFSRTEKTFMDTV